MIKFENFPENFATYVLALMPIIAYVIKLTIDNWGITELEKLRLSNFKKFQIALTKYLFIGIFFVASMYLLMLASDGFSNVNGKLFYGVLAFGFIIFIAFLFLAEKFIDYISGVLSFKYDYHIVNHNGESLYRIIKLSSNNLLLVESNGIEEFIDAKGNYKYKRIRKGNDFLNRVYNSDKTKYVIIVLVLLSIGLIINVFLTTSWMQFFLYFAFMLIMMITLLILLNYLENKKFNENETINNNQ